MPYYNITAYNITYDIDKNDCISVGADGEDYYLDPLRHLSESFQFRVEKEEGYDEDVLEEIISNLISERTGFCVESFESNIEEEEVPEGIPPQLPEIPYPPPKLPSDKWENYCETEEREEEITMEFVKYYKLPSLESIKHFVDNYKGENEIMPIVKNWLWWSSGKADFIYESFIKIMENPEDEEKCKDVGKRINYLCSESQMSPHGIYCFRGANSMGAMRSVFYLVSWYFESSNNQCIKAYPRLLEHYWDGIGDWAA